MITNAYNTLNAYLCYLYSNQNFPSPTTFPPLRSLSGNISLHTLYKACTYYLSQPLFLWSQLHIMFSNSSLQKNHSILFQAMLTIILTTTFHPEPHFTSSLILHYQTYHCWMIIAFTFKACHMHWSQPTKILTTIRRNLSKTSLIPIHRMHIIVDDAPTLNIYKLKSHHICSPYFYSHPRYSIRFPSAHMAMMVLTRMTSFGGGGVIPPRNQGRISFPATFLSRDQGGIPFHMTLPPRNQGKISFPMIVPP